MATITENYCSKEIYRLLIAKGFDGEVHTTFDEEGYTQPSITLQMAMKWLREVYNLSIRPRYEEVEDEKELLHYLWFFDILSINPYKMLVEPKQGYDTYEEAAEEAIKYCLENLI